MKLILAVPAVGLLFSGAIGMNRFTQTSTPVLPTPNPEVPTVIANAPRMWAQTAPIHKGEKFDLSFETPHAAYLGVIDPSGKFF
ncbi:MAG: hypothetical protein ABIO24_10970, partial [Saprospiraceae bacterium]